MLHRSSRGDRGYFPLWILRIPLPRILPLPGASPPQAERAFTPRRTVPS